MRAFCIVLALIGLFVSGGCRSQILNVDIVNQTADPIDVIALIPRHKTWITGENFLMHAGVPRLYAATIDPDAVWSRRRRERYDLLAGEVQSGSTGHLIVMVRRSAATEPASWQNHRVLARYLEPITVTLQTSETTGEIAVHAATRQEISLEVRSMTEQELRDWNPHTYSHATAHPSLLIILDARDTRWPLRLDER